MHGAEHLTGTSLVVEAIGVVDVVATVVISGGQLIERSRFTDIVSGVFASIFIQRLDWKSALVKSLKPVSKL